MKRLFLTLAAVAFLAVGCGNGNGSNNNSGSEAVEDTNSETPSASSDNSTEAPPADDSWKENKGIGPVKTLKTPLAATPDAAMAAEGKELFINYCSSCHKVNRNFLGPMPKGILERRTPEWVMNMIMNPEEMRKKDPIAKKLHEQYPSIMTDYKLKEDQVRAILEYFRTLE